MKAYEEELKQVRALAKIVRKAIEHIAQYEANEGTNDMNDAETLGGYCARASALLSCALERADIEHVITGGNGHIFIKWKRKVVDITATQFSDKVGKTVICNKDALKQKVKTSMHPFWHEKVKFRNRHALWEWQVAHCWPDCQMSHKYDDEFLEELKEYKEYQHGLQKRVETGNRRSR